MKNKIVVMSLALGMLVTSTATIYETNAIEINLEQELTDSSSDDFEDDTTTDTSDSGADNDTIDIEMESEDTEEDDSDDDEAEDVIKIETESAEAEKSDKGTTNTSKETFSKTGQISLWDIVMDFLHSLVSKWF